MSLPLIWTLICAVTVPFFVLQTARRNSTLRLVAAAAYLDRTARTCQLDRAHRERHEAALRLIAKAIAPSVPEAEALAQLGRTREVENIVLAVGAYCSCYLIVAPFAELAIAATVWLQGYGREPAALLQFGMAWPLLIAVSIWSHETRIHLHDAGHWLDQAGQALSQEGAFEDVSEPRRPLF